MRNPRLLIPVVALVALAAAACGAPPPVLANARLDFTMKDMHGNDVKLADLAGKPIVVNFWATWCAPCKAEMPMLVELAAKYAPQGLTIVGISTDDEAKEIRAFAEQFKVPYPMLVGLDRKDVLNSYGYTSLLPLSVFIRADGKIADRLIGARSEEVWENKIRALF